MSRGTAGPDRDPLAAGVRRRRRAEPERVGGVSGARGQLRALQFSARFLLLFSDQRATDRTSHQRQAGTDPRWTGSSPGWADPWEDLSLFPRTARRPSPTPPNSVHATRDRALRWSLMSATGETRSGV